MFNNYIFHWKNCLFKNLRNFFIVVLLVLEELCYYRTLQLKYLEELILSTYRSG